MGVGEGVRGGTISIRLFGDVAWVVVSRGCRINWRDGGGGGAGEGEVLVVGDGWMGVEVER